MTGSQLGEDTLGKLLNSLLTESEVSELLDKELLRDFKATMNLCVKGAELIRNLCKERPNGDYCPLRKDEMVWVLLHTIRQLEEDLMRWKRKVKRGVYRIKEERDGRREN